MKKPDISVWAEIFLIINRDWVQGCKDKPKYDREITALRVQWSVNHFIILKVVLCEGWLDKLMLMEFMKIHI